MPVVASWELDEVLVETVAAGVVERSRHSVLSSALSLLLALLMLLLFSRFGISVDLLGGLLQGGLMLEGVVLVANEVGDSVLGLLEDSELGGRRTSRDWISSTWDEEQYELRKPPTHPQLCTHYSNGHCLSLCR